MVKQKVITVNINIRAVNNSSYQEIELTDEIKYLDEDYFIVDRFPTLSNATEMPYINLTFILEQGKSKRTKILGFKLR